VATDLAVFKKEKQSPLCPAVIQLMATIQTRKSRDSLNVQWAKRLHLLSRAMHRLMDCSRLVPYSRYSKH